jgi:hypothetical protein
VPASGEGATAAAKASKAKDSINSRRRDLRIASAFPAEQPSSAAAAALNDKKLLKTNIAAAVGCSGWFGLVLSRLRS